MDPTTPAVTCEGTTTTRRDRVNGYALEVVFANDCGAHATWRVDYLDGTFRHVCDKCVSPCTIIPLLRKAERL